MKSQKGAPAIYTWEKRRALQENARKDAAVRTAAEKTCREAESYLEKLDALYGLPVSEGLFRYYFPGHRLDPNRTRCRHCGEDIAKAAGLYGWIIHPLEDPWKITCPVCGSRFPSNDFESYYRLGLDRKGVFSRERAERLHREKFGGLVGTGFLKNTLYPEKDSGWGVDDGFGCGRSYADGHGYYIAMYLHTVMYGNGAGMTGPVPAALTAFRDAYLYTGDPRFGRAGAILLDRIADLYPDYDWYRWHELRGDDFRGNICDAVWSCILANLLARCYDAFYPVYEDPELIAFLSDKASRQGLANPKDTADALRFHVEERILRTIFRDSVRCKIAGNFGMTQSAVAAAAVALNTLPETAQWLDWVLGAGDLVTNCGPNPPDRMGGNLLAQLTDVVDRDGMGNESAPGYNRIWISELLQVAKVLDGYKLYPSADLYRNPKFIKMLYAQLPLIMGGSYTAHIGDAGACGSVFITPDAELLTAGFMATKDPVFAQVLYLKNGNTAKGLRYPETSPDPSRLERDVEGVIAERGRFAPGSTLQSGYGLMALRKGNRDFWMYAGSTDGHGHSDGLNLGISAFGLNIAPEMGYPKHTGPEHNRIQWVSATISHNTVVVDGQSQQRLQDRGDPLHFDDAGWVRLMDADKHKVYPQTELYRRTLLMVDVDGENSYGVDFFRIRGGKEHLYSFHAMSHEVAETDGLALQARPGTYAGEAVPYGPDPSELSGVSWDHNVFTYPDGYTWLDGVQTDAAPNRQFGVDFAITDYRGILEDPHGLHLRLTMVGEPMEEVSLVNGYPPAKAENPQPCLKYLLAKHKGSHTLFSAVLEPYRNRRFIRGIEEAEVLPKDPAVRAVRITLETGRVDYILYGGDSTGIYTVDGRFRFRGFAGVISFEGEKTVRKYLHDGDLLEEAALGPGAITGTILDFTRESAFQNSITVQPLQQITDVKNLADKCIRVENDGQRNATYRILDAERQKDGSLRLFIGDVTLIRSYRDRFAPEQGYLYDIAPGDAFRIPLTQ